MVYEREPLICGSSLIVEQAFSLQTGASAPAPIRRLKPPLQAEARSTPALSYYGPGGRQLLLFTILAAATAHRRTLPPPRAFTMHGHSTLQTHTELFEYICNENSQDVSHITGKDDRR
jgi:hypothetical protein